MSGTKLKLTCLVWPSDQPRDDIVMIKPDNDETVSFLKKMIKDEHSNYLRNVDTCDLVLWKCSIPGDDKLEETLKSIHFDVADTRLHRLNPFYKISKIFTTALPDETIHILVQVPEPENEAPSVLLPSLSKKRQRFIDGLSPSPPSTLGVPSQFSKHQQKEDQKIIWSRPPTADATIPVTLLHPTFRQFIDDCKNHQPIADDNKLVLELMTVMSDFFLDKDARVAELCDILMSHGIPAYTNTTITSKDHHFLTNGVVEINSHLVAIIEVKDEISSSGAEPYAQIILYYSHSTAAKSREFSKFNFPSLLITVFGPQISFSGAVWTTRPHFQVLTPTWPLFCHSADTDMRESLARHFGAFKAAILSLEQCYNALENPALLEHLNPEFPDPCTYRSLKTETTVNFKYSCQIDEEKLLFLGENDNGKRICIKFVRRYSRSVHEKCAEMGIAPELRGFEDIGAGWKMVIMDALDEEYKPFDKENVPLGTAEHLRERLIELHQANFVHGDIRDANIMVRKDGKLGYMLVDFDWSGIIGEVYYPININNVDLWRPDDVSDGLLIKSDHDMAMLERIFSGTTVGKIFV